MVGPQRKEASITNQKKPSATGSDRAPPPTAREAFCRALADGPTDSSDEDLEHAINEFESVPLEQLSDHACDLLTRLKRWAAQRYELMKVFDEAQTARDDVQAATPTIDSMVMEVLALDLIPDAVKTRAQRKRDNFLWATLSQPIDPSSPETSPEVIRFSRRLFQETAAGQPRYVELASALLRRLERTPTTERSNMNQQQIEWLRAVIGTPHDGPPQG